MLDMLKWWADGPRVITLTVTTDSGGAATAYFDRAVGYIHSIQYTKVDFATGVDFTITNETTAQGIWTQVDQNASAVKYPRFLAHDLVGVALAALTAAERIFLGGHRVKVVIAQGGNTKTGTFTLTVLPL